MINLNPEIGASSLFDNTPTVPVDDDEIEVESITDPPTVSSIDVPRF